MVNFLSVPGSWFLESSFFRDLNDKPWKFEQTSLKNSWIFPEDLIKMSKSIRNIFLTYLLLLMGFGFVFYFLFRSPTLFIVIGSVLTVGFFVYVSILLGHTFVIHYILVGLFFTPPILTKRMWTSDIILLTYGIILISGTFMRAEIFVRSEHPYFIFRCYERLFAVDLEGQEKKLIKILYGCSLLFIVASLLGIMVR